jgi:hypothetical protein
MLSLFWSISKLTSILTVNIARLDALYVDKNVDKKSTSMLTVNLALLDKCYVDFFFKISQHSCQLTQEGYA